MWIVFWECFLYLAYQGKMDAAPPTLRASRPEITIGTMGSREDRIPGYAFGFRRHIVWLIIVVILIRHFAVSTFPHGDRCFGQGS